MGVPVAAGEGACWKTMLAFLTLKRLANCGTYFAFLACGCIPLFSILPTFEP
jgi:hypothetical protein